MYTRTWKKILPIIFDVFTSDILNLGFCLKPMSTLGFGFTSNSIIGSSSNFRLTKLKMANNKNHYRIQLDCVHVIILCFFCLISFELTLEHQLSWLNWYRIFRATSKLSHFKKKKICLLFPHKQMKVDSRDFKRP